MMPTHTGDVFPLDGRPDLRSSDGCTYGAPRGFKEPVGIVRYGSLTEIPGADALLATSPDGSTAIVRVESMSFHLVDLDHPTELGPSIDLAGADSASFAFVTL